MPLAQCTLFSYEGHTRPRILAVGDRARTEALPRISQDYVTRFYPLDGSVRVMQAELAAARSASLANPRILLHRQKGSDIAHGEYRAICYELPQVAERLAILALHEGERWLSVNFYRGIEHGPFDDAAIAVVEAFAPLVVHAVRLHYGGQALNQDLAELMMARVLRRCPALIPTFDDVLLRRQREGARGDADHHGADHMAEPPKVVTISAVSAARRFAPRVGLWPTSR